MSGRYIYSFIAGGSSLREYGDIGINGGRVYTIDDGRVAAVVSDVPMERLRPERRRLAAHQAVIKRLMDDSTPLPIVFGVVADDEQAVHRVLHDNQPALLEQLQRVEGRVEMGLRVRLDVRNVFEYFVEKYPELQAARDRFMVGNREPTRDEKLELGRLFTRALEQERARHMATVEEFMTPYCLEMHRNTPCNEEEVMHLVFLIERNAESDFEKGVFAAAEVFDNDFAFDFSGPWAPHNFVDLSLDL